MSDAPRILLLDDEPNILSALRRTLRKEAVEIRTSTDPNEALGWLEDEPYAVVISDQRMPQMEGTQFLERARAVSPDTVRILLTGHADLAAATQAINESGVFRFLSKPWEDDDLRHTVRQALDQYALVQENKRLQALTHEQHAALADVNKHLKKKVMERTWEVLDLNQKLQQSFMAAVQAMARLAEMHSNVVGHHSKRVASLARMMGERLDLTGRDLMHVEVAATLHDIGKTLSDPKILGDPDPDLSQKERIVLRMHVIHGEAIVRLLPGMETAARYVRSHHERFDGSGYPDQLQGEAIPLGARIIAVADAYDHALNPAGPVDAVSPTEALHAIQHKAPYTLDPALVKLLEAIVADLDGGMPLDPEIELTLGDLQPHMVLSRDLFTSGGVLLLPAGSTLTDEHILRLHHHHASDPILTGLFVHRASVASVPPATAPEA